MKFAILITAMLALSLNVLAADGGAGAQSVGVQGYTSQTHDSDRNAPLQYAYHRSCRNCGTVSRIDYGGRGDGHASGAGAVAGALIGAALGNQIGSGDGRKAATVAGAVAGGVAGNRIERSRNRRESYAVVVHMDDGRRLIVQQRSLNGVREGSRVIVRHGRAYLL